jgi:hypothetical protein
MNDTIHRINVADKLLELDMGQVKYLHEKLTRIIIAATPSPIQTEFGFNQIEYDISN